MDTSTNNNAPPNPYTNFQAGVTATLRSWSALRTAVEQSWGGTESPTKAEDLRTNIFTFFDGTSPKPKMSLEELEDNLLAYMEEEFGIVLEDGSEIEISNLIWNMYECCSKGDVALADSVVENAIKAEELMKQGNIKKMNVIQSGEDGDDDDDDMDDDSDLEGGEQTASSTDANIDMGNVAQQQQQSVNMAETYLASGPLFGGQPKPKKDLPPPRQLGEPEPEKPQPEVDDDGFAVVTTKKRGKKRA